MASYIELAKWSLEQEELAWPSRPKWHVPSQKSTRSINIIQHRDIAMPVWGMQPVKPDPRHFKKFAKLSWMTVAWHM
jgi:hypothetical protein